MHSNKLEALLRSIDTLIERYGETDPVLASDLRALREQLTDAARRNQLADVATFALRAATWIKFVLDHLPPPH